MEGVILTHLSGSRASQEDVFPLDQFKEIIIGRDYNAHVVFGASEAMVGRQHAKIAQDAEDPGQFFISDLKSRNGTYLNKERIFGKARIKPGDVVQCGFGGPEFRFSIEPETDRLNAANMPAPTANLLKYPSLGGVKEESSRVEALEAAVDDSVDESGSGALTPQPIGKLGKALFAGIWLMMGLIGVALGYVVYRSFKSIDANPAANAGSQSLQSTLQNAVDPTPLPSPTIAESPSPTPAASPEAATPATAVSNIDAPSEPAPTAVIKPRVTTLRKNTTTVARTRPRVVTPVKAKAPIRPYVDPKEEAKRLKKEQKKREKEAKKKKSKY